MLTRAEKEAGNVFRARVKHAEDRRRATASRTGADRSDSALECRLGFATRSKIEVGAKLSAGKPTVRRLVAGWPTKKAASLSIRKGGFDATGRGWTRSSDHRATVRGQGRLEKLRETERVRGDVPTACN